MIRNLEENKLDQLVRAFATDSVRYKNIEIPASKREKQEVLRALMNIRMPGELEKEALKLQDEYLKERALEKGLVTLEDVETVEEKLGSGIAFARKISVWQGDITRLTVDAIVNAANSQMLGCFVPNHACIDNAIHTFAGVELRNECDKKMQELKSKFGEDYEQPTGIPMLTEGYNLPAKHVIHVVGPIVSYELTKELEEDLAACYRNSLELCKENGLRSIAFCCISTGVFHFPNDRAAEIAVNTVMEWLDENPEAMDRVIFNVFKDFDKSLYEERLR